MRRRRFITCSAALLAMPSLVRAEGSSVLRYVPVGDLPSTDPILLPSYEARSHGFMVFDTLYGQTGADQGFVAKPQMVGSHTVDDDGKTWTLTLRDGLSFHDGSGVLARDCVASIRRGGARDQIGQTLMQRIESLSAPDDRTISFRMTRPFVMLPEALGKFGVNMCAIMPESLANTDPFKPVPSVIGSGPYRFQADEQVPGSLHVYSRFGAYVPRADGPVNFISGPKIAHFDRVEWHINPDQTSACEALQSGEIDWLEYPLDDLLPFLQRDRGIKIQQVGTLGFWGILRPNCLFPPFNSAAIRRALLGAIDQTQFMTAAIGADQSKWRVPTGYFPPGSPMASDAGLAALAGPRDLVSVRRDIEAAGYRGEKVIIIVPASLWRVKMFSAVATDMLRMVGMNVEEEVLDAAAWARRLISRSPPDQGGWNLFCTSLQGLDALTPANHIALRGNGEQAFAGWPSSPRLEELRDQWLDAPDTPTRRKIAAAIQTQAFIDVPYFPLGTFYPATAFRSNLTGVLDGQAIFWNVRRQ